MWHEPEDRSGVLLVGDEQRWLTDTGAISKVPRR